MLNTYEQAGKWLCKLYYAPQTKKKLPDSIRKIIEGVIIRDRSWISLMSGDLRNKNSRQNFLGPIIEENICSVDGKENHLRSKELTLYSSIGLEVSKFLKP